MDGRACRSLLRDCGVHEDACGYCERGTSAVHGAEALSLCVEDYQRLLDRSWRRSGRWLYLPLLESSCCRPASIRVLASKFRPGKDLRRSKTRMKRFLDGMRVLDDHGNPTEASTGDTNRKQKGGSRKLHSEENSKMEEWFRVSLTGALERCVSIGSLPDLNYPPVRVNIPKRRVSTKGALLSCATAFGIAAAIRRSGKKADPHQVASNILLQVLEHELPSVKMTVEGGFINLLSTKEVSISSHYGGKSDEREPQEAKGDCCASKTDGSAVHKHSLTISIVPPKFDEESFELFFMYQTKIHNQAPSTVTRTQYVEFLVETPIAMPKESRTLELDHGRDGEWSWQGYGTFHHQYRVDGKLVAVGVVDVLPCCLSSKYLFWHPKYRSLSLGKYAAMKEIEWVVQAQKCQPELQYYYPGYYIPSCPKMVYKALYQPAELLCPFTHKWYSFESFDHSLLEKNVPVAPSYTDLNCVSKIDPSALCHIQLLKLTTGGKLAFCSLGDALNVVHGELASKELLNSLSLWQLRVGDEVARHAFYMLT